MSFGALLLVAFSLGVSIVISWVLLMPILRTPKGQDFEPLERGDETKERIFSALEELELQYREGKVVEADYKRERDELFIQAARHLEAKPIDRPDNGNASSL